MRPSKRLAPLTDADFGHGDPYADFGYAFEAEAEAYDADFGRGDSYYADFGHAFEAEADSYDADFGHAFEADCDTLGPDDSDSAVETDDLKPWISKPDPPLIEYDANGDVDRTPDDWDEEEVLTSQAHAEYRQRVKLARTAPPIKPVRKVCWPRSLRRVRVRPRERRATARRTTRGSPSADDGPAEHHHVGRDRVGVAA